MAAKINSTVKLTLAATDRRIDKMMMVHDVCPVVCLFV
jgi:hypothetical protein